MDIVSRLRLFLSQQDIAITQFADNCGISRPTLSQLLNGRNKKVSDDLIRKIHHAYPSLSVMWLMFGEGNMYINGFTAPVAGSVSQSPSMRGTDVNGETDSIESDKQLSFDYSQTVTDSDFISDEHESLPEPTEKENYNGDDNGHSTIVLDDVDDSEADSIGLSASVPGAAAVSIDFGHSQSEDNSVNDLHSSIDHEVDDDPANGTADDAGDIDDTNTSEAANSFISDVHLRSMTTERKIVNIIVYYDDNSFESFGPLK